MTFERGVFRHADRTRKLISSRFIRTLAAKRARATMRAAAGIALDCLRDPLVLLGHEPLLRKGRVHLYA
jgi:hypothetical protein